MQLEVDSEAGAVYLRLREGRVHETRQLIESQVMADLDEHGALLGIELLDVPIETDSHGYAHVNLAVTTSEGRTVELAPKANAGVQARRPTDPVARKGSSKAR